MAKKKQTILGIIPARMASTRFPGKPLAKIGGKAMIHHVYENSRRCKLLDGLFVATPDKSIEKYCKDNQLNVLMTSHKHLCASDRAAEAMLKVEKKIGRKVDIVVMIQGDEPMLRPQMITNSLKPLLEDSKILVSNLMATLNSDGERKDPNFVKVVVDRNHFALYYSREPIPSPKKGSNGHPMYKQVPIIPFRRDFLIRFNKMKPTPLERVESVDMLRVLENGYQVKMVLSSFVNYSVDTKQDLSRVRKLMKTTLSS